MLYFIYMGRWCIFLFFISFLSCSGEKIVNYDSINIEYRHEIPWYEHKGAPFTGVALENFSDVKVEHHIKTGLEYKQLGFYSTGEKERELFFVDGVKHGKCTMWWRNGNLLLEETYVDGNLEGAAIRYDSDGNEIEKKNYVNGMLELDVAK